MSTRRIHYVDWLRVLAVLLLFPFHAGRVFNFGEPFYAKSATESVPIGYLIGFIDAWHMPLLFLLAGASTYFALKRRTLGRYSGERAKRLLVPLVFGTFVLVPPQTWYGARTNDAYAGSFVEYITSGRFLSLGNLFGRGDYFGGISPAHLWFIMYLFVLSMLALPLLAYGRTERGRARLTRMARGLTKPGWWPLAAFAILVGEALPDIADKPPFYYLAFFVLGYIAMHDDGFGEAAERLRVPALAAGLAVAAVSVAFWRFRDTLPDPSLPLVAWAFADDLGAWMAVFGLLGFGRRYLDKPSPALSYLGEASYPVYILHQTVIVVLGFYVVAVLPSPLLGWPLLMLLAAAATFALYEGVRRVGALRFLFGMKPTAKAAPAQVGIAEAS